MMAIQRLHHWFQRKLYTYRIAAAAALALVYALWLLSLALQISSLHGSPFATFHPVLTGYGGFNAHPWTFVPFAIAQALLLGAAPAVRLCQLDNSQNVTLSPHRRIPAVAFLWGVLALCTLATPLDLSGLWYALAYYPDNTPSQFLNFTGLGAPRVWPFLIALLVFVLLAALLFHRGALARQFTIIAFAAFGFIIVAFALRRAQTWYFWNVSDRIPWHRDQYSGFAPAIRVSIAVFVSSLACLLIETWRDPPKAGSAVFCKQCRYDLRATPSGQCPECGQKNPIVADSLLTQPTPDTLK